MVKSVEEAVADADVVMVLTPDEFQSNLYRDQLEPNLKQGATLAFAHALPFTTIRWSRVLTWT